ncbi:MAG: hypothetical protein HY013_11800 [Candidatus Solibacter usitatus]|nr:hypothetical protein [Candidatus Solibacter usitatus]
MADSYDPYEYLDYLRGRARFLAATCAVALGLSLGASLLLPKKYTATARLMIEPPASSDPRAAMAVSPIYLESLRTFEILASSDNLFRQAVERFGLREGSQSLDSLKKSVLKVSIPRNTKVLEIIVKLGDPRKAQAVAQYLAEEAVKLNRKVSREGDQELAEDAEQMLAGARAKVEAAEAAWLSAPAMGGIEEALTSLIEFQTKLRESLAAEESDTGARVQRLNKQIADLEAEIVRKRAVASERSARRDRLSAEREAAQAYLAGVERRVQEARGAAGTRAERLKMIDPGVVPERPSSPNLPLNLLVALLAAVVLWVIWVTLEFGYRRARPVPATESPARPWPKTVGGPRS